jgi:ribose 5-phosphate isomerase
VAFYIDVVDIIDHNISFVKCEGGANLMSLKAAQP